MDAVSLLKKYILPNEKLYELVYMHGLNVANKALEIVDNHPELNVDKNFVKQAALIHDIGIFKTFVPKLYCYGHFDYMCHGVIGRKILDFEGFPEYGLVCERHTGTGLTVEDIVNQKLPLPLRDMCPMSLEEKLICYSDLFFSKTRLNQEKKIERIRCKQKKFGKEGMDRFNEMYELFK